MAFFLFLTSPFAIYYATTARMYSLMVLWGLLGFLALVRALESPTPLRLVLLAATVAGMLYTHYWAPHILAITAVWLLYQIWRHRQELPIRVTPVALRRALVAVIAGSLLFVPWMPIFVFQTLHTGTPWTSAAGPADLLGVFADYAGSGPWAELLAFLYFGLIVLGVFGRRADVDTPGRPGLSGAVPDGAGLAGNGVSGPDEVVEDRREADAEPGCGGAPGAEDDVALIASGLELGPRRLGSGSWPGSIEPSASSGSGPGGAGASARRRQAGRGVHLVLNPTPRALPVAGVYSRDAAPRRRGRRRRQGRLRGSLPPSSCRCSCSDGVGRRGPGSAASGGRDAGGPLRGRAPHGLGQQRPVQDAGGGGGQAAQRRGPTGRHGRLLPGSARPRGRSPAGRAGRHGAHVSARHRGPAGRLGQLPGDH